MTDTEKLKRLRSAATALYFAGRWTCHRLVDEQAMWNDLRDALELEPGVATMARVHSR